MAERVRGPRGVVGVRTRLVLAYTETLEPKVSRYFLGMSGRLRSGKAIGAPGLKAAPRQTLDWKEEARLLAKILEPAYAEIAEATFGIASDQVGVSIAFDLSERNIGAIIDEVGLRVTQINESSRDAIRALVKREIESGSNADRLQDQLRTLTRSWAGLTGPVSMSEEDRRRLSASEAMARSRAHSISLTETGNAYNKSSLAAYRESGLVTRVVVYDGADCGWEAHDDPDLAAGSSRSLDEAAGHPLSHPHCQRAFGPQVERVPRR